MIKITFDFLLSILGIILSFPLWIVFSLLIWLDEKKNPFYLQERVGKNCVIFKSIQFRSMVVDAEAGIGPIQAVEDDRRITRFGHVLRNTAMDELPQLLNIVKGDMSFVGPRALRPEEKEAGSDRVVSIFEYQDFKERFSIRPGLTGVAQILLPRDAPRELKFKYDLWYIKHQTFWLDIYLIFLSFLITFNGAWEIRRNKIPSLTKRLRVIVRIN